MMTTIVSVNQARLLAFPICSPRSLRYAHSVLLLGKNGVNNSVPPINIRVNDNNYNYNKL